MYNEYEEEKNKDELFIMMYETTEQNLSKKKH
jgi:hypothetical protein